MLLYKYRSLERLDFLEDIVRNERLYCPPYHQLNDPFEGIAKTYWRMHPGNPKARRFFCMTTVDDLMDPEDCVEARVCSLSSTYSEVRMWSYYGGAHRGVAVEIELGDTEAAQVRYGASLLEYDEDANEHPTATGLLCYKTNHWEFEKEYRLFSTNEFYPIQGQIRRVIAGPRCRATELEMLKTVVPEALPIVSTELDESNVRVNLGREVRAGRAS